MYKTMLLDCQTKNTDFSCEDCIAYKKCKLANKKRTNDIIVKEI